MSAIAILRGISNTLTDRAATRADYEQIEALDEFIEREAAHAESLAELRAQHAAELIAVITHPRIRFAPPSADLIAANAYGEMPHPVCQEDSGE